MWALGTILRSCLPAARWPRDRHNDAVRELEAAAYVALELMECRAPWLQPAVDRAMVKVAMEGARELLYCNAKLAWYLDIKFSTREVRAACSPPIAV